MSAASDEVSVWSNAGHPKISDLATPLFPQLHAVDVVLETRARMCAPNTRHEGSSATVLRNIPSDHRSMIAYPVRLA